MGVRWSPFRWLYRQAADRLEWALFEWALLRLAEWSSRVAACFSAAGKRLRDHLQAAWTRWRPRPLPLGRRGERLAEQFLRRRGLLIVARGARDALGELDLVAVDGRTLVFVEVKTRRSEAAGRPEEAVDEDKQRRITRAALAFLKRHQLLDYPARMDVVAIVWPPNGKPTVRYYPSAFEATDDAF